MTLGFWLVLIPLMMVSAFIRMRWPKWGSFVMYLSYLGSALVLFFSYPYPIPVFALFISFVSLSLLYLWYMRYYKRSS